MNLLGAYIFRIILDFPDTLYTQGICIVKQEYVIFIVLY